jgi:hypothetical protein
MGFDLDNVSKAYYHLWGVQCQSFNPCLHGRGEADSAHYDIYSFFLIFHYFSCLLFPSPKIKHSSPSPSPPHLGWQYGPKFLYLWSAVWGCTGPYVPARELFFHLDPLCLTLPYPPYGHFRGGPPTEQTACGQLLPFWTPHILRLWQLLAI